MYRRFLSVRYFRTRLVNWLSVVGVMVGVAVMIVVWSVFTGFSTETRKVIRGTLADLTLAPWGRSDPPPYPEMEAALRACPEIVATVPRLSTFLLHPFERRGGSRLGSGTAYHPMTAIGVDWDREVAFVEAGRKRGLHDLAGLPGFVIAAESPADPLASPSLLEEKGEQWYAETLKGMFSYAFLRGYIEPRKGSEGHPQDYLGQTVAVTVPRESPNADGTDEYTADNRSVVVTAVYQTRERDVDLSRVFLDRAELWAATRPLAPPGPGGARPRLPPASREATPFSELSCSVPDFRDVEASKARVVAFLERRGLPEFRVLSWQDQRGSILRAVNNERMLLAIVIAFIGLLAGFTILATLTLTVIEKTRDIGVLLALGATGRGVMTVFLLSGVLIGVLGALLGVLLGIGLTKGLNPFRDWLKATFDVDLFPPEAYGFEFIPYVFDVPAMIWISGGCMVLAFFASLLPALRASRLDPVVALRHE